MFSLHGPIDRRELEPVSSLPSQLRKPRKTSTWGEANKPGQHLNGFIEGPTFLPDGKLAVVDIAYGRILAVDLAADAWSMLASYDGEPNGMALDSQGNLVIADYRRGLLGLHVESQTLTELCPRRHSESFKGLNDVITSPGHPDTFYFTDQGQTGLHDPTGRVYRFDGERLDLLISNGVSPNGLALSADGHVLFVSMTRDNSIWRIPLHPDGGVSKVGKFCQMFGTSGPDGLALTDAGDLLVAHASLGSVFRFAPNGELREILYTQVGATVTNVTLDPADPNRIFVTESSSNTILTLELDA